MTGAELRTAIATIRNDLKCGYLSYDEAKEKASYFIDIMNTKAKEVAKKYGKTPPKFSFSALMR
jgi:hypothetical protein